LSECPSLSDLIHADVRGYRDPKYEIREKEMALNRHKNSITYVSVGGMTSLLFSPTCMPGNHKYAGIYITTVLREKIHLNEKSH